MRKVILCLTLILASWGVAAEQAKSPKKGYQNPRGEADPKTEG
jgi:hypothetical protein